MGLFEILRGEEPGFFDSLFHCSDTGHYGEYCTEFALKNHNIKGYSKTLCNVYVPNKGRTSELDVVLIHEKGIFVFESKNYSGWIFGSVEQQKWTQCLVNNQKYQFYNPIKQNITHCKALSQFLNISLEHIHSYIIFSNRCELKKVPEDTDAYKIVKHEDLLYEIRKQINILEDIYSEEKVDELCSLLKDQANVSQTVKEEHIDNIKKRMDGDNCPYCGSELKLRSGKYGNFYGCSNYPKCKFTKKCE